MHVSTVLPSKQPRPKSASHAGRILHLLESARGGKVTLPEILALRVSQYNARIFELRHKFGFRIENGTEPGRPDHTWFRLVGQNRMVPAENTVVNQPQVDRLLFTDPLPPQHRDLG